MEGLTVSRNHYHVPEGRMADPGTHHAPERTATRAGRGVFSDRECRVWPSRGAMLAACRMSERGEPHLAWRPLIRGSQP